MAHFTVALRQLAPQNASFGRGSIANSQLMPKIATVEPLLLLLLLLLLLTLQRSSSS
jgi:hypothetical protein